MSENAATPKTGQTRDARGRTVKLLDPIPIYMLGRNDVMNPETLEAVVAELDPGLAATGQLRSRRRLMIIVAASIIVLGVIIMGAIIATGDKSALRTLKQPYFYLPIFAGAIVPYIATRAERMKKLRQVMLAHHACPHCGYDLHGLPREHDGTTCCAECGCAWIVPNQSKRAASPITPDLRASNQRFRILLIAGLTLFALAVIAFLVFEFNN